MSDPRSPSSHDPPPTSPVGPAARPVVPSDVLDAAGLETRVGAGSGPPRADEGSADLDDDGRRVLGALGARGVPVDVVVRRTGLAPERVQGVLLRLVLRGLVRDRGGGRWATAAIRHA